MRVANSCEGSKQPRGAPSSSTLPVLQRQLLSKIWSIWAKLLLALTCLARRQHQQQTSQPKGQPAQAPEAGWDEYPQAAPAPRCSANRTTQQAG